jgi:hypothetical protein
MSFLDDELDALTIQSARPRPGRRPTLECHCTCSCRRCRGAPLDETARPARRQTSPGARGPQLPGWRGWTPAVSLRQINQAQAAQRSGRPVPPALAPFLAQGPQVYRLSRAGIDRDRPLNIGMTKSNKTIAQRIREHHSQASRGDPPVHQAIRNLQPGQILVQAARLTRQNMHPRRARNYEGWLQDRERPLLYNPNSTTFDEAGIARRY